MTARRRLLTFMFCSAVAGALLLATVVFSLRDQNAASWVSGGASLLVWGIGLLAVWPVLRAIRADTDPGPKNSRHL